MTAIDHKRMRHHSARKMSRRCDKTLRRKTMHLQPRVVALCSKRKRLSKAAYAYRSREKVTVTDERKQTHDDIQTRITLWA